jgi:hypothetical protein
MKKYLGLFLALSLFAIPTLAQDTVSKSLTLNVTAGTVVISTATVPNGMIGLAYTASIAASGGLSPYSFSISAGALPAGISLNSTTGVFSGTPTATGAFSFTVQATDSETPAVSITQAYTMNVYAALAITTNSLPGATIGTAYSTTLVATGGLAPYKWAVTSGALPTGITLSVSGVLSGTPTASGSFTFSVTVTDAASNVAVIKVKMKGKN